MWNIEYGSSIGQVHLKQQQAIKWAGHVARMGGMRNAYKILLGKPEGKRPLGRPRSRW
jgi:hypothetical protein